MAAHTFFVQPRIPEKLKPLELLALDLYWSWLKETEELFLRLDEDIWEECGHNPNLFLYQVPEERLAAASQDPHYLARLEKVWREYQDYFRSPATENLIAYFSAEFGLAQVLPIYAGGLGILAGDHLKTASDLKIPLVGVGLLYRQGYFRQKIDGLGEQREIYPRYDFYEWPVVRVRGSDGSPLMVEVDFPDRPVKVYVWEAQVGSVKLYLLDTDVPENWEADRNITDQLYGGDLEKRLQQEIILGIGGVRALKGLNLEPHVYHLNEGHSAFLALEHIRQLKETYNLDFAAARELASPSHIFTTHTPVPAGIDLFPPYLMDKYFTEYYQSLGLSRQEFLALGRKDPNNHQEPFNMAVLALRLSAWANGVSRLHGYTARKMWQMIWPEVPEEEIPIGAITNGVHVPTWVGSPMAALFDHYLGITWRTNPADKEAWRAVKEVPDIELWQAREKQREALIKFIRKKMEYNLKEQGANPKEIEEVKTILNPRALTIGFARRFAAYKRPDLLFYELERLAHIVGDPERPVQIIYAGKAHPQDEEGKKLVRQIVTYAQKEEFRGRVVFLEDYDMELARLMVQGVDVWLANPRRPLEACSTSGMKAVLNGALYISTLDGWWDEAWEMGAGWAIGQGEVYTDPSYQDALEASSLYSLLEKEVIPLFYERDEQGIPKKWLEQVKNSIKAYAPIFNSHRMVEEYAKQFYFPAARLFSRLKANDQQRARELAGFRKRVEISWGKVQVEEVKEGKDSPLIVGEELPLQVRVSLGALTPRDVKVMAYYGKMDSWGEIGEAEKVVLKVSQDLGEGRYLYEGTIPCRQSGRQGYKILVVPYQEDFPHPYYTGLVLWG
ncbi:starch phosphorylase [Thermanaeromonas toyohensis ToBE]|uniref:Starch phosphorylase n=1 Tax=Thermanaeromonas toyohensis ToBE TaxID=698762 RepID=A0A1W1W0Q8_9FIRM|nr:alpha-glucan family phosphorylase [Thermanaeromonas toyohensis]SMB98941.1 starch phosphorylase [Thermanaeromonas toyohensis ToBE]